MANGGSAVVRPAPLPEHVSEEQVYPLDHWNGPDFLAHPVGFWDELRDERRVFWSPFYGGFWCLTRYDDIAEAFRRPDVFSSRLEAIPARDVRILPFTLDPPEHSPYRRLLNQPFAPTRMQALAATVRQRAELLMDEVLERGECDFMTDSRGDCRRSCSSICSACPPRSCRSSSSGTT